MKTSITKGLDHRAAEEMRQSFVAGAWLRKRIRDLLQEKIDTSVAASRSKSNYDIANWAYLQADAIGYQRAMQEIISLLTNESDTGGAADEAATTSPPAKKLGRPKGSLNRQKKIIV